MYVEKHVLWRYSVYSALANYYLLPSNSMLDIAHQILKNKDVEPCIADSIRDKLVAIESLQDISLDQISEAYHDLFIGVTGGTVSIYGSAQMTGSTYDAPLIHLRKDLGRLGLTRSEGNKEPEDHLASLFEIMTNLVIGFSEKEQSEFFYRHINPFIDQFCSQLLREDFVFYNRVAELTSELICFERKHLPKANQIKITNKLGVTL